MRARAIVAMLLVGSMAIGPIQAKADPFRPSIKDQIQLGKDASEEIEKEYKVVPDSDARVRLMRRLAERLVNTIPAEERRKRPFEYRFSLIDDKEVNAFALPGGPIYFYTGLFDLFETEDQLAGVLAHEIVHVRNQHWASAYADNQKRRLGLSAVLLILGANDTVFDLASVGDALFSLDYSRRHETEADKVAVRMILDAGYNPQGLADVFKKFQELKKGGANLEWFSTHPDDAARISNIGAETKRVWGNKPIPDQRPMQPRLSQGLDRGRD